MGYKSSRGLPVLRLLVWPLGGLKLFWGVNWGALDLENCKSDRGQIFRSDVHLNELVNECLNGFLGQSPFPRWPPKVDPIFLAFSRWRPGGCLSSKIDVFRVYASRMSCLREHVVEFEKVNGFGNGAPGGGCPKTRSQKIAPGPVAPPPRYLERRNLANICTLRSSRPQIFLPDVWEKMAENG